MAAFELLDRHDRDYLGLRMTADEFLALPEDPSHYELVDGVVVMSPSPSYWHQKIIFELLGQLHAYLGDNPIGEAVPDVDVKIREDLVYRPDIVYFGAAKAAQIRDRVIQIPDLVIEVISPSSRGYDSKTKRQDYEAAGVGEYWLIDADKEAFTFLVLRDGGYQEVPANSGRYASSVLSGFELDLERIRAII